MTETKPRFSGPQRKGALREFKAARRARIKEAEQARAARRKPPQKHCWDASLGAVMICVNDGCKQQWRPDQKQPGTSCPVT